MKLQLICPNCGKHEWKSTELNGEPIFQCNHCNEYAQPEEMIAEELSPTYYYLEKFIPSENAWFFEGCFNSASPSDLNALVVSTYLLGKHQVCGWNERHVRIMASNTPPDNAFSPSGYPKFD